jgi:hypothetical protein
MGPRRTRTMRRTAMMKRVLVINLMIFLFSPLVFDAAYAVLPESADVLPKGISSVRVDANLFFQIDKRFDPDGKAEKIAADYNTVLNSSIFPGLRPLDPFVGGSASIGDSIVSSKFDIIESYNYLLHGVTDRLTVGVMIPYWWVTNHIKARVDSSSTSSANVGLNPCFGITGCPSASPVIPLALGGVPLTTENVQNLLGSGLPGIPGFGYKRVETWSGDGISDIEAGFKYQYLKTESWRLAFTGAVRFPTGEQDDPENLMDYAFGSGAYALLFRFHNDYTKIKNLILDSTLKYDLVLPDTQTLRVPDDVNRPVTINEGVVKRDQGDKYQIEVSGKYALISALDMYAIYNYRGKFKDHASGNNSSFNYNSVEAETNRTEHIYEVGFIFKTLSMYAEKKFPLPISTSVSYRSRFAGSNNSFKSKYIGLVLQGYF